MSPLCGKNLPCFLRIREAGCAYEHTTNVRAGRGSASVILNHPDHAVSIELRDIQREHGETNTLVCCPVKVCLFWPGEHLALARVISINRDECTSVTIAQTAWVGEVRSWRNCASRAWSPSIRELVSIGPYRDLFLVLHLPVIDSGQNRGRAATAWVWAWAILGLEQNSPISSQQPPRLHPPPTPPAQGVASALSWH